MVYIRPYRRYLGNGCSISIDPLSTCECACVLWTRSSVRQTNAEDLAFQHVQKGLEINTIPRYTATPRLACPG